VALIAIRGRGFESSWPRALSLTSSVEMNLAVEGRYGCRWRDEAEQGEVAAAVEAVVGSRSPTRGPGAMVNEVGRVDLGVELDREGSARVVAAEC